MAALAPEERNRSSPSVDKEEKWTHATRIEEELKRVAEKMASKSDSDAGGGGRSSVKTTIIRAPQTFRETNPEEFRYDPVEMRMGLYNRGDLQAPTAAEKRRMAAAIAFLNRLNARRFQVRLNPLSLRESSRVLLESGLCGGMLQ